ncbi:MAG: TolC family protein [Pseudomonadota bacterium]
MSILISARAVALAGVLACAISAPLAAPLTLGAAQQLALSRSHQLNAQDQAIAAAHNMARAAAQLPDPVLRFGIDNLPVSGADRFSLSGDFMTMRRLGLMQEFTRADKLHWRAERFEREADKALAAKSLAAAAIERDTAIAWFERLFSERMALAMSTLAEQARQETEAAQGAYRAGRASQGEVFAARGEQAALADRASELARRVRNARTMLARWTGETGEAELAGMPALDALRVDPHDLERELGQHPQIALLDRQEQAAQAEARLAQANQHPDWSVELAFQQRGPAYSNMISVGLSLPLQWDRKQRQDRELAARLAQVEQARAERDEALRAHVAETRTQIADWENGRERIERYQREQLPLAAQRTQALLASYRGGKATLAELLAARRNEVELQLQALQLQLETARLWAQLNYQFPQNLMSESKK